MTVLYCSLSVSAARAPTFTSTSVLSLQKLPSLRALAAQMQMPGAFRALELERPAGH